MSSTRVKDRKGQHLDFYETPAKVVQGLLNRFSLIGDLLEPSAGRGAILEAIDYSNSTAIEIQEEFKNDLLKHTNNVIIGDFLTYNDRKFDTIIANPPFSQSEQFIRHAYGLLNKNGRMAFLLRLPFLASVKRYQLFQEMRPAAILILSQRPKFGGTNIDSCDYAWFLWEEGYDDNTILDWLPPV